LPIETIIGLFLGDLSVSIVGGGLQMIRARETLRHPQKIGFSVPASRYFFLVPLIWIDVWWI